MWGLEGGKGVERGRNEEEGEEEREERVGEGDQSDISLPLSLK